MNQHRKKLMCPVSFSNIFSFLIFSKEEKELKENFVHVIIFIVLVFCRDSKVKSGVYVPTCDRYCYKWLISRWFSEGTTFSEKIKL